MNVDHLIQKSKNGDQNAFGELVLVYSDYVFSVVFRLVNSEVEAEDIVQNVFVKAWEKIETFNSVKAKFSTWLYTIASRMAIDFLRHRKTDESYHDIGVDKVDMEHELENKELGLLIRQACKDLSATQKLVFVLRDLEELDVEEVVLITGYSEKKIKDNLYVARKKVREKLSRLINV